MCLADLSQWARGRAVCCGSQVSSTHPFWVHQPTCWLLHAGLHTPTTDSLQQRHLPGAVCVPCVQSHIPNTAILPGAGSGGPHSSLGCSNACPTRHTSLLPSFCLPGEPGPCLFVHARHAVCLMCCDWTVCLGSIAVWVCGRMLTGSCLHVHVWRQQVRATPHPIAFACLCACVPHGFAWKPAVPGFG